VLGADTDVVMEESGVPQAARDALRAAGVI
jgi:hypothetical protein